MRIHDLRWAVPFIAAAMFAMGSPALAQSEGDLRRENQRLRAELEDTQRELEAAKRRIAELEQQVESLRRGESPPTPKEKRPPKEEGEDGPASSPLALFNAVVASYEQAMEGHDVGRSGSRERAAYMRALRTWRSGVNRDFRAPVAWHVRVLDEEMRGRIYALTLLAVDPTTHEQRGDPFEINLPVGVGRRYAQLRARRDVEVFVLRGVVTPHVQIDETRAERGIFDRPRFISPFAEFGFAIEQIRSFMPVAEDAE
jgi:hypothetical protein